MSDQEKLELIAEVLELESNNISPETQLDDLMEYDSMAKLSVIVLMDEEFNKKLTGEEMSKFETIADIMNFAS